MSGLGWSIEYKNFFLESVRNFFRVGFFAKNTNFFQGGFFLFFHAWAGNSAVTAFCTTL